MVEAQLKKEIENIFVDNEKLQAITDSFNKRYLKPDIWMYQQFLKAWTGSENTYGIIKKKKMFSTLKRFIPKDIKEVLKNKADKNGFLTLFRGTGIYPFSEYELGYACSYTDDPDKARWFAKRFLCLHKTGFVVQRKVHLNKIVAFINNREEREIIIIPSKFDVLAKDYFKVIEVLEYIPDKKGNMGLTDITKVDVNINNCSNYNWNIVNLLGD